MPRMAYGPAVQAASSSAGTSGVPVCGNERGVVAQTAILTSIQVLSPAVALLAEVVLAWRFGASGVVDAYRVTVLLLIYGQQLFVSSILPFVLVPIFAECRAKRSEQDAWIVADSVGWLLVVFGTVIAVALFCFPELAVSIVAPGVAGDVRTTAVFLIRWCGLAFIPLCWTGAACGILYAYDTFYIAPLSQLTANLALVFAIAFGAPGLGAASLAVGVLAGASASTIIYSTKVAELRRRFGPKSHAGVDFGRVRTALKVAAPLIGSVIAGQSTSIVVNRVLSRLPVGTLAAFGYAWKMSALVQLMPTALSTVLFPKFSKAWYSGGQEDFAASCIRALRAAIYIAMPLTALCWMLRRPLVELLFQRGAFTRFDAQSAGILFGLLILNGPAASVAASLNRAFYAVQETRMPVLIDIGGNALALVFIPLLASRFGAAGAAFAYMLLPWIAACGLIVLFRRRFGKFPIKELSRFAAVTLFWGLVSAGVGAAAGNIAGSAFGSPALISTGTVLCGAVVAATIYYLATLRLGFSEARSCGSFIRRIVRFAA